MVTKVLPSTSCDREAEAERGHSAGALAEAALREASADPARAVALAEDALVRAHAQGDVGAASTAEQALGAAALYRHDLGAAVSHLRKAVTLGDGAALAVRAARARVALCGALAVSGDTDGALREADRAAVVLRGMDLALLHAQRAFLLQMGGKLAGALEGYTRALPAFRRAGDRSHQAKVMANRGLVHLHLGNERLAAADLLRAEVLYVELGQDRAAAHARLNLGYVAARRGDLPEALRWFERADEYFRSHGEVDALALFDRAEVLLGARLAGEARCAAGEAVDLLEHGGSSAFLAEARLRLAQASLLDGDPAAAAALAEEAARDFRRQRRPGFGALARFASIQAAWAAGDRSAGLLARSRRTADALEASGWAVAALEARLIAGRLAVELGRLGVARSELERAARATSSGPVQLRSRAWHAQALLRLADGDRRGADAALRAGMGVLESHRAVLGATELRAHASAHATDLAKLGLRLAIDDGSPVRVLAWAERWRAGCLHLRPVRPPNDAEMRADLARLRKVTCEMQDAAQTGRDTSPFLAREAALQEAVRRRARQVSGLGLYRTDPAPDVAAYRTALDGRGLVELMEVEGVLFAVVLAGGPPRLHRLGPLGAAEAELDSIRFALRRMATGHGSPASRRAASGAFAHAAKSLDDLVLGPVAVDIGDRPLVIVPTGVLHAVPWSALPSCRGRPLTVAPSAALWHRAATAPRRRGRTVVVAGPRLPDAAREANELHRVYESADYLDGTDATVEAVKSLLDGAELAHVAAHGCFRTDNPLFSSLELADGPLTVYDLEALRRAPATLVLSACDSGLSDVRPGDELMGLASALFALGTQTLIASVVPVGDAAARPLMVALHEGLRQGRSPAAALAAAQVGQSGSDEGVAASASFVCFGAG